MKTKPIPNAPGYFARSDGAIIGPGSHGVPGILRPETIPGGYLRVQISINGVVTKHVVNRLIARTFHGKPPSPKHQAAHRDGDTTNNTDTNIYWATPKKNAADRIKHGTSARGERNGISKLTEHEVIQIRNQYSKGQATTYSLAEEYGVSQANIWYIIRRKQWKHVP